MATKVPQFKFISCSQLKYSKHNPKRRLEQKLGQLCKSIQAIGLQYPILVTSNNVVIDGHRRLAAYKRMGLENIASLVTDQTPNDVYSEVNANAYKLSGNDAMYVYLVDPTAVRPQVRRRFQRMEDRLGRPMVETLQKHGFSVVVFCFAEHLCKECECDTDEWVKRVVRWLMTCESLGYVRSLVNTKMISPARVLRAAKQSKPLTVKVT